MNAPQQQPPAADEQFAAWLTSFLTGFIGISQMLRHPPSEFNAEKVQAIASLSDEVAKQRDTIARLQAELAEARAAPSPRKNGGAPRSVA